MTRSNFFALTMAFFTSNSLADVPGKASASNVVAERNLNIIVDAIFQKIKTDRKRQTLLLFCLLIYCSTGFCRSSYLVYSGTIVYGLYELFSYGIGTRNNG